MDHLEDQVQAAKVKAFWNETGKYLLLAVFVGLVLSFAWKYWKHRQLVHEQEASALYMKVLDHSAGRSSLNKAVVNALVKDHPKSIYASMAQLDVAGFAMKKGQYKKAEVSYHWVMKHTQAKGYKSLASCRLARVLLAQKKPKEALTVLQGVTEKSFSTQVSVLRSRAYLQLGRKVEALKERSKAGKVPVWL